MKSASLIYNKSLINKEHFIETILSTTPQPQIPTCEIKETNDFYFINIDSFYEDKHILEISYKDYFLILKIKNKNNPQDSLLDRIFYLKDIDLDNILLQDHKNQLKLIITKI